MTSDGLHSQFTEGWFSHLGGVLWSWFSLSQPFRILKHYLLLYKFSLKSLDLINNIYMQLALTLPVIAKKLGVHRKKMEGLQKKILQAFLCHKKKKIFFSSYITIKMPYQ